ncbi:Pr6Pr family membrane protein [Cellulomonas xylanilytica]|uniref:F420-dependent oxidoreductase n=1 Tax=Cellulomonas xylanilytica TaxID=233583 RepID=A0A510VC51_9CELL|nr:Pr6Pr family membrane protein [Cellulomonas xylanilytica]GEK23601.1 hypothetical protein CXY01_41210 [Cellulomonas xylanilytica]
MTDDRPRYVLARTLHAIVLVAAVVGLSLELARALTSDDLGTRLVRLFSYFTIQSNILAAVAAGMLLWRPDRRGRVFAVLRLDALLCIAVTGIVYHAVLAGLQELTPSGALANLMLHTVVPVGTVVAWLVVGPRPRLSAPVVGWSLVYPLGWIAYTFLRGAVVDWYPYPFLDVSEIGLQSALVRTGVVAVIFLLLAFAALGIERVLPPAPRPVVEPVAEPVVEPVRG